ncbi:CatA-like O-acetyltransferase [Sneathiella glossodoripedis]|uniref:CatA-like O-acetyltransferase n=1 Tax=Sneathiella glossodoripedis TaxID=418853 RepID=UPI00046F4DBC|nr:CatA-like O-acetyltransferase [Sneathiella glossodoripedis]
MSVKEIEIENWPRRDAYELFRKAENPFFSLTTEIDITRFVKNARQLGLPHFVFTMFSIMRAVNSIDELRTRFDGNRVEITDQTDPSFTVPIQNNEFAFCEVAFSASWETFKSNCLSEIAQAKKQTQLEEKAQSRFYTYLSCMPWVHFTGALHPTMNKDDCIPRIVWGKYVQRGDRWIMALNLQAHHSLVDGFHAAEFFRQSEANMAELPETIAI